MLDARRGAALEPIRSELLGSERLAQHGRGLGRSHRAAPARFGQTTFYPRLQSNIRTLRAAYHYVVVKAESGEDISPAAEWLFDNFHLIEGQLREIREGLPARYYRSLPVLQDAPLAGLPRIYGVAWAYVAHTDSAFDEHLLVHMLDAYQDVRELSQGELWALPTTLRVVLVENLRRLADRIASQKAARELAGLCAQRLHSMGLPQLRTLHALMVRRGVGQVFLCALVQSLAVHWNDVRLEDTQAWLLEQVPELTSLQSQEAADQAADHLSIGNAVTALRRIASADWQDIVSRSSRVIQEMLKSAVFAAEDDATRNDTLHGIERLSVLSAKSETQVARALLSALRSTQPASLAAHWLQGEGRSSLEHALGMRARRRQFWRTTLQVARTPAYFGALATGTLGLVAALLLGADVAASGLVLTAVTVLLMLLPASEAVVALVNRLIGESVRPVHLPRLLLAGGIPTAARTLVVIPALLSNHRTIETLMRRLELHYLANPEAHAQFALLSDWNDADTEHHADDEELLAHAVAGMRALNTRYPASTSNAAAPADPAALPRFLLLHRNRSFSTTQRCWLGWERKRGKLQQLVAMLEQDSGPPPFFELEELSRTAPGTRYLLTLDSDTQLPPGRLRALVGVAEHPQNQPVLSANGMQVVRGYGILQPRVVPPLAAAGARSPWQWLLGGQGGMDPYSAMSSDTYQDLFGEGSFTGKGLLHVATLHAVLGARLPTEQVLSHDLLEGALVRCAVVSDVTLIEPEPAHSDTEAARLHRWIRGDWQLLPFVVPFMLPVGLSTKPDGLVPPQAWPLSAINRWKLLDNLRRSLVAPAALVLLAWSMTGHGLTMPLAVGLVLAAYAAGPLMGALALWVPRRWDQTGERFLVAGLVDLCRAVGGGLWHLSLLPLHALNALDAVLRTIYRLLVSHRLLLQWTTAEASHAKLDTTLRATLRRHSAALTLAVVWAGFLWAAVSWTSRMDSGSVPLYPLTLAILLLWTTAPLLVWVANRVWITQPPPLALADRELLAGVARDTWRLFERCVDARNHHLPPDNLQSAPFEIVAPRTSPTNIGLYLLSVACARQMGWIGTQDLLERLEATLHTLQRLERHRGHFLNWYNTQALAPLLPRYVSTVDSGNLSAHLLAVAQACTELQAQADGYVHCRQALRQSRCRLLPGLHLLTHLLNQPEAQPTVVLRLEQTAMSRLLTAEAQIRFDAPVPETFHALLAEAGAELARLPPTGNPAIVDHAPTPSDELQWLLTDHLATWRSALRELATGRATQQAQTFLRLQAMASALDALAWEADFGFLYHHRRHLLHIGYRPEEQLLDTAFYDLLASESRTTSLLAIAKGDVPVKHWAALGRPFFVSGRHAVLRSWSGSMFEYLMPTLVMAEPRGSALGEAARSAVREQRQTTLSAALPSTLLGTLLGNLPGPLPWGQSESAYAVRDHTLAYQYAPQGVARLALRRTPLAEYVVAPYATVLASQVDAGAACTNLRLLSALGARGRYGYFEALDYTPARQSYTPAHTPAHPQLNTHAHTLVRTWMAHHQGMSIVALTNVLQGGVAQRWGMAHPRLQAVAMLLQERAPRELARPLSLPEQPPEGLHARRSALVRTLVPGAQALEPTHLLSNGRFTTTLRPNGAGWSRHGTIGIGRWRDDALRDAHGSFLYMRRTGEGPNQDPTRVTGLASLTSHPAPDPQARYQSQFHADRVVFAAHWDDLEVQTTVWVSPEDDIELRQVMLHNLGHTAIELDLVSAFDVTLATHAADEAHPAFSGMFARAEWRPTQQALHWLRTPRLATEHPLQAAHFVASAQGQVLGLLCQTDRLHWLGRHHTASCPLGTLQPVPSGVSPLPTGLDPVSALGVRLRLEPGTQACVTFGTAASEDATTLQSMVDKYRQPSYVERSSVMSATLASIPRSFSGPRSDDLPALHALTTALVLTLPKVQTVRTVLKVPPASAEPPPIASDRRLLWPLGLSGTRPLLLVAAGPMAGLGLLRALVQALREWERAGLGCDLVVLSDEAHSYHMPLQHELTLMTERPGQPPSAEVTALHLLRREQLSPEQIATLEQTARLQLQADGTPLLAQVQAWAALHEPPAPTLWGGLLADPVPVPVLEPRGAFKPAQGEFVEQGRAFRFGVTSGLRTPRPWINVLANPGFGTLVTDSGAGNTWAGNSRLNQLTAWSNDPVADPPGEWFLLQDRRTREVWSATPSAWGAPGVIYTVTHTQGLTTIEHRRGTLAVKLSWCVDPLTALKQVRIKLTHHGIGKAHLRITGLVEWMLGEQRSDRSTLETQTCLEVHPQTGTEGLLGLLCTQTEAGAGLGGGTAFFCESHEGVDTPEAVDWTCDRRAFFDPSGQLVLPARLGQRSGLGLDPCAALSRPVTLRPGASISQVFLLGYASSPDAARSLMREASRSQAHQREAVAQSQWDRLLGASHVRTPDPLFDALVNHWLLYQAVSSRLWAKAGFYQAGGATGYRDQLQDTMALVWADPTLLRAQIVLCASRQFEAGDVQHWWHAASGAGARTHFSDDLLWLPFATAHYLKATGQHTLLDEEAPFLLGPPVPEGAEDRYDTPATSTQTASVYEHGARAIDHSLRVGVHGLPLMGTGDWNDGMNRVGHEGRGESVWLAWFLCHTVREWLPLALARGDTDRAQRWEAALAGWRHAMEHEAWDGAWYRRAFFDDASPLGSGANPEGRIDLIAQAWAVLSGEAPLERQRQAMQAAGEQLVDHTHGLVQLLTPPLVAAEPSAGYIQAYPPGVRENGGQYTHGAAWALMAAAELSLRNTDASTSSCTPYQLFTYLSPAHRASHPEWGSAYGLEPYAVAADVYSQPPYRGKGGWSWYTGAAGWLHRSAVESILGLHIEGDLLWFTPCIPAHWPGAELTIRRGTHTLHFSLQREGTETVAEEPVNRLKVSELLRWPTLPSGSRVLILLPAVTVVSAGAQTLP